MLPGALGFVNSPLVHSGAAWERQCVAFRSLRFRAMEGEDASPYKQRGVR